MAASSYLNTAPLIWSFAQGPRRREVELFTDAAPARCADLLIGGAVDVALVPVIEYQRHPDFIAVPGVCVGSRRRVRSVVLVTRGVELRDVRSVALDVQSRTSAALVNIIFREFLGRAPRLAPAAPDLQAMLRRHDAALLIGDPAMVFPREQLRVYDLAELWREYTGLGFVFAMWMARRYDVALDAVRGVDFAAARDEGLGQIPEIALKYEAELKLPRAELRRYLEESICFTLDGELEDGLRFYFQLAHKHGAAEGNRPLEFL